MLPYKDNSPLRYFSKLNKFKIMVTYSDDQINALKYLIFKSKDADLETKKICFALIDASERFTKPVYFTSNMSDESYGTHNMVSANGSTHLTEILQAMSTEFIFSTHQGFFASVGNFVCIMKNGEKNTLTIWLSNTRYDNSAVEIKKEDVEKLELKDPLYDVK
jgi:hypothetical protein